jgi:hypothetical protein
MKNILDSLGVFWNLFKVILSHLDWQHVFMLIFFPAGDAALEIIANGGNINSKLLSHAFYVFIITAWAIIKRSPMESFVKNGTKTAILILGLGLSLSNSACSASIPSTTTPVTLTAAQKDALTVAFHAADAAWNLTANTCVVTAQTAHDDTIRQKCAAVLEPARIELIKAGGFVDTWTASSPAGIACSVENALRYIVSQYNGSLPPLVTSALALGQDIAGNCPTITDGGISQ